MKTLIELLNFRFEERGSIPITSSNQIEKRVKAVASKWAELSGVETIGLFGSWARGNPTLKSDIDIYLIISDTERRDAFEMRLLESLATLGERVPLGSQPGGLHWVIYRSSEFENPISEEDKGIVRNIKLEGKKLV